MGLQILVGLWGIGGEEPVGVGLKWGMVLWAEGLETGRKGGFVVGFGGVGEGFEFWPFSH